jgi:glycosyltransferase involved in cell wall biosynthesis
MNITVVLCTYNRCESLKEVLDDLLSQNTEGLFDYEIIVVDNNSNDATRATVASFIDKFKERIKYLFEPAQGKSYALNTGIKSAQGGIIVTNDDDCSIKDDYLKNIYQNFKNSPEDVVLIGGKIAPKWMSGNYSGWLEEIFTQSPKKNDGSINWVKVNFEGPLGILDYGNEPILIDWKNPKHDTRRFYGANMAFRKNVFEKTGDFKEGKTVTEDTEICDRIFRSGFKGLYVPDIQIEHKIYRKRYSLWFYYQYFFKRGIIMDPRETYQEKFYHPLGIQSYLIKDTFHFILMSFNYKFDLFERAFYRCRAFFNLGQMIRIAKRNIV